MSRTAEDMGSLARSRPSTTTAPVVLADTNREPTLPRSSAMAAGTVFCSSSSKDLEKLATASSYISRASSRRPSFSRESAALMTLPRAG